MKIAIVGMACEFPGAGDLGAYWRLQLDGVDATTDVPPDRFPIDAFHDPRPRTPGRIISRRGGFLPDIRGFDAQYFGVSGREAAHMDPQQRLLLHTAAAAVQDAGLTMEQLAGSRTAVVVGQRTAEYWDLLRAAETLDIYANVGTSRSVLSGRLSFFFDLRGPSTSVDTACSSSLVAVHQACATLRAGEATLALAGASTWCSPPRRASRSRRPTCSPRTAGASSAPRTPTASSAATASAWWSSSPSTGPRPTATGSTRSSTARRSRTRAAAAVT
ncbi:hypothetical protein Asp14428_17480 [Actinoplanes sp. NBRC 14428]|nr:hypothetical protein Asp14428_17480 [Actinoplanes sp. NBRC 14428]